MDTTDLSCASFSPYETYDSGEELNDDSQVNLFAPSSSAEDPNLACKFLKSVFSFKEQTAVTRLPLVQMVSNFRRTFLGRLPLHHPKSKKSKNVDLTLLCDIKRTLEDYHVLKSQIFPLFFVAIRYHVMFHAEHRSDTGPAPR